MKTQRMDIIAIARYYVKHDSLPSCVRFRDTLWDARPMMRHASVKDQIVLQALINDMDTLYASLPCATCLECGCVGDC